MNLNSFKPYQQLPGILLLFIQMLSLGTYLIFFLVTFLTFDSDIFDQRLLPYYRAIEILLVMGLLTLLILITNFIRTKKKPAFFPPAFEREIKFYFLFLGGLLLIYILRLSQFQGYYFDFFLFLFGTGYLIRLASIYTAGKNRPSWQHPTTAGAIIQGTLSLGIIFALWEYPDHNLHQLLYIILMIILLFEGFTLWGRFSFLSKAGPATRVTARMLLGSHLALFGIRFIFGLVMPLVYLIWIRFISASTPYHPLVLMIFIGELSDRILFYITTPTSADFTEREGKVNPENTGA